MKKYGVMLLLLCLALPVHAQETTDERGTRYDVFGAPTAKFSQMNESFALLGGGRFGWVIGNHYVVGAEGYWLANDVAGPTLSSGESPDIELRYGGLTFEYVTNPYDAIHYSVSTLIGVGAMNFNISSADDNDNFYVVEPAANVYFRMTQYFKIGLGLGYRYVGDLDVEGLEGSDLSGITATLSFHFGTYGTTFLP